MKKTLPKIQHHLEPCEICEIARESNHAKGRLDTLKEVERMFRNAVSGFEFSRWLENEILEAKK